jgi:hypothetical protein
MRAKRRFAQSQIPATATQKPSPTARKPNNDRMDAGDFVLPPERLHNFRVTPLCMSCTRLMNKKLQLHEFH